MAYHQQQENEREGEADPPFPVLIVPRRMLTATHDYFLPYWQIGVETACYWCGIDIGDSLVVTTLGIPRLEQDRGYFKVIRGSAARMADIMEGQGLIKLAQIHTHPPKSRVWHSFYDNQHAYSTRKGALSLVWPEYGRMVGHDLAESGLGIHELKSKGWTILTKAEIAKRIRLVDDVIDDRWDLPIPQSSGQTEWEDKEENE